MQIESLVHLITRGLLELQGLAVEQAIQKLQQLFPDFEWTIPYKANAFSIAGALPSGEIVGYVTWLNELKLQGANKIQIQDLTSNEDKSGLSPQITAAFANGHRSCLKIHCANKTRVYYPAILYSSEFSISGPELEELFDFQFPAGQMRTALWQKLLQKDVIRYGEYSEATTEEDVRLFTRNVNFEMAARDLLKSAQIFCAENGEPFKIPEHLSKHLCQENRTEQDRKFFSYQNPGRENEFVPESEKIYFAQSITVAEYLNFIDAQGFKEGSPEANEILARLKREVRFSLQYLKNLDELFPESQSLSDFRKALLALDQEVFSQIPGGNLSAVVQEFVRGKNKVLVIPAEIRDRIKFFCGEEKPLISEDDLWRPKPNPQPWQMMLYNFGSEENMPMPQANRQFLAQAHEIFLNALQKTQSFAKKHDNPFEEAFRLAIWILKSQLKWNLQAGVEDAIQALHGAGFSDRALDILKRQSYLSNVFELLDVPEDQARGFFALSIAEVFGGMGSWNDQYFEGPAHDEYQKNTADLFAAFRNYTHQLWSCLYEN